MEDISLNYLFISLVFLLILSAFFSSSETGMLSLNRYKLKHRVNSGEKSALRVSKLLDRPDRLIGVILIGNNLVNVCAASIVTLIGGRLFGDMGILIASILLTLTLLVFAEVTPKTIAAVHPERIAFPASLILRPLLTLLYPAVVMINVVSNALVRLFGVNPDNAASAEHLRPEELRTVVDEAGDLIPDQHQGMLLNVLDLEKATVEDIMVPRSEIIGIDLLNPIETILPQLRKSEFTRLPVYEGDINNMVGVLHLRDFAFFCRPEEISITSADIRRLMIEPYFVPESTPLHIQLLNFKREKRRFAVVVDEYGEIQGIATLVDLLEEVVGDFSSETAEQLEQAIAPMENGWFRIETSLTIRDINRQLEWDLSTEGPKTINGLLMEFLESIPDACCSCEIGDYRFEIVSLTGTRIEQALATKVHREEPEE